MIEYEGFYILGHEDFNLDIAKKALGRSVLFGDDMQDIKIEIDIPAKRTFRILSGFELGSEYPYSIVHKWKYIAVPFDNNPAEKANKAMNTKTSGSPHYTEIPPIGSIAKFYTQGAWLAGWAYKDGMSPEKRDDGITTAEIPWSEIEEWRLLSEQ